MKVCSDLNGNLMCRNGTFGAWARGLKERAPEPLSAILEMTAFVNFRRAEASERPMLVVSADL